MYACLPVLVLLAAPTLLGAQASGRFPPDSLINVHVFPKTTPVMQVVAAMRDFTGALGVRCHYCHVGEEGRSLETYDFAVDRKRTKLVARQMMRMTQEINRRLDTIPDRPSQRVQVTCATCHRGTARPMTLAQLLTETATAAGADSAARAYRALRQRYYGRDAYDFSEFSLNSAALRLGRAGRYDDAFVLLRLNEEMYPNASSTAVVRGNVVLMRGDTTGAAAAFREAIRRDSTNNEARGRLRAIGRQP
jgi:hypothetical protein